METNPAQEIDSLKTSTIEYIKIREILEFKDLARFKIYLVHIFDDLCYYKDGAKIGLSRVKFSEMLKLPTLICEKLFNYIDSNSSSFVDLEEFTMGMSNLFFGSFEETCRMIFSIFDFDKDGSITKEEVYTVLTYLPLKKDGNILDYFNQQKSLDQLRRIIDFTFNGKQSLSIKEFIEVITTRNAFIYLQLLCYFYMNCPFKEKTISFVVKWIDPNKSDEGSPSKSRDKDQGIILKYFLMNFSVVEAFIIQATELKIKEEKEQEKIRKKIEAKAIKERLEIEQSEVKRKIQRSSTQKQSTKLKTFTSIKPQQLVSLSEMLKLDTEKPIAEVNEEDGNESPKHQNKKNNDESNLEKQDDKREKKKSLKLPFHSDPSDSFRKTVDHLDENEGKKVSSESVVPNSNRGIRKMGTSLNIQSIFNPELAKVKEELIFNKTAEDEEVQVFKNGYFYQINNRVLQPVWIELVDDHICVYTDMNRDKLLKVIQIASCFIQDNGNKVINNKKLFYTTIKFESVSYVYYCLQKSVLKMFIQSLRKIVGYRNIFDDYTLYDEILSLKSYVIKRGVNIKTREQVDVKIYEKGKMTQLDIDSVKKEIDLLRLVKHPCFINYIDNYENSEFIFIVVSSFYEEITLREYIFEYAEKVSAQGYMMIIYQLVDLIRYLENLEIIHTNLRADTVKIIREPDFLRVKVPIFGIIKPLELNRNPLEKFGVIQYLPPEAIEKKQVDITVNVWSFGITLYQMFAYVAPFDDRPSDSFTPINRESIKYQILKQAPDFAFKRWKEIDKFIIDFIKRCLEKDPKKRLTIKQMVEDTDWIDLDVIKTYY